MAQVKRAIYKVDNGTDYDTIHFETEESMVKGSAGEVVFFARSSAPTGWLKANGAAVSRYAYSELFAAIGTYYGAGDGSSTFNLPDLRGVFIRGLDEGRGIDSNRSLGSYQGDSIINHHHTQTLKFTSAFYQNGNGLKYTAGDTVPDDVTWTGNNVAVDSSENRVKNVALIACIKY